MQQSPTTRERITELFTEQSSLVLTPTEVAQAVDRSLDSVRTEMRGMYNAGQLHRKLLKGNLAVYWAGDDPVELTGPRRLAALPPAIEVRSVVVAV